MDAGEWVCVKLVWRPARLDRDHHNFGDLIDDLLRGTLRHCILAPTKRVHKYVYILLQSPESLCFQTLVACLASRRLSHNPTSEMSLSDARLADSWHFDEQVQLRAAIHNLPAN